MNLVKTKELILLSVVSLYLSLAAPARAVDIATHSFAGCGFPDTNQSVSYTTTFGEDHDYGSSVSTMSFTVYNPVGISSVTVDNRTGLMWVTNPNDNVSTGTYIWANAIPICENLNYAGYSDWRLPTLEEAMSLMEPARNEDGLYINPVFDSRQRWIWTSDRYGASSAWVVLFSIGYCCNDGFKINFYVRAVR